MTQQRSFLTILTIAFIGVLTFSSLGLALERDSGGAYHIAWSPIATDQPLPATGVTSVAAAADGSFVATVQNENTEENEWYSFDPANSSAGWQRCDAPEQAVPASSADNMSSLPFAYGCNKFSADVIALPDDGFFNNDYKSCNGHFINDAFCELLIYGGNALVYYAGHSPYYWHTWPCNKAELIASSAVDRNDLKNPYFQSPHVFYVFKKNSQATFYIASALETKTNQYFSLVISYGFPVSLVLGATLVADPIAPAGELIVGVAGSEKGYVEPVPAA